MVRFRARTPAKVGLPLLLVGAVCIGGWAAHGGTDVTVSQRGRKFNPLNVDLIKGEALAT